MIPTLLCALLATPPARGGVSVTPFPTGNVQTINILEWDTNQLPRIFQRSDQLPLTNEEIARLSEAGFEPAQLVKMLEERRCACDASADGLIALKKAGVHKDVLAAVSLHSLAPNRALNLDITLDFTGQSREAREAFLYFFIDDKNLTRVMAVNLADLLARSNQYEEQVDLSDLVRPRTARRIRLPGQLPLTSYGKHNLLVVASRKPNLTHPSQLTAQERKTAQTYTFDYPRSSLQNICRLNAAYQRDAVLAYRWRYLGSRLECEWN